VIYSTDYFSTHDDQVGGLVSSLTQCCYILNNINIILMNLYAFSFCTPNKKLKVGKKVSGEKVCFLKTILSNNYVIIN